MNPETSLKWWLKDTEVRKGPGTKDYGTSASEGKAAENKIQGRPKEMVEEMEREETQQHHPQRDQVI